MVHILSCGTSQRRSDVSPVGSAVPTATEVLKNAVAWFADRGVAVKRVLSDNGSCYKSHLWRDTGTVRNPV